MKRLVGARGRALAVVGVVLLIAACAPVAPPLGESSDPISVVEAYLEARNSADWEAQRAFLAGDARSNPFGSRDEVAAAGLLERVVRPVECSVTWESERSGSFVACLVEVTDVISEVSGRPPTNPNASTFVVQSGFIVDLPEFLPSDFVAERAIETWAEEADAGAYRRACPSGIAGQSVITGRRCAEFVAEHRNDWADAVIAATNG